MSASVLKISNPDFPPARIAPAVSIRSLDFRVEDKRKRSTEILADVNLDVAAGEFVSIVGPSGCGKSTLLNFVAGLLPVQSGELDVFTGKPGQGDPIGYMFQQHGLLPWRSILRNVEIGLEVAGVNAAERTQRSRKMLADMGLAGFEEHYPNEISGGMRQRASLARTLVANPALILMDEPFGALDAQTKIFIQELFSKYWESYRKTVLFVTHDLAEAVALSDRVLVMSARPGHIIAEYRITIPRPRDFSKLRSLPRFNELTEAIWSDLREQAALSMQGRI
jgi:NitT/TauT family transport system ATP-binding protein